MTQKVFWDKIFKIEILTDLHVLRFFESENYIFNGYSTCMCVNSVTQNEIIVETPHMDFDSSILHR